VTTPTGPGDAGDELSGRFPELFQLSPQPISLSAFVSGRYIDVNQAWLDFLGYTREEVIGKTRTELSIWVSATDRERLRSLLGDGRQVRNAPLQCRKKSGEIVDILFSSDPIQYGGELCLVAALNDISALKRTERLLKSSEERFGKIFEAVPQCITMVRASDSVLLEVNQACELLYGYSRAEMIGRSVIELGWWVDLADRAKLIGTLAPGQTRMIETRFRHKSGRVIEAHCAMTCTELGGQAILLTTSLDITDRKRAERLLKASEERFAKMIEASPQTVTITRLADGMYLHVNQSFLDKLGYQRAEVIGRTAIELGIWVDPAIRDALKARFAAGESVVSMEAAVREKDGGTIELIFTGTVLDMDGETVLHGTSVDLSEVKRALHLQRQSEERLAKVFRTSVDPIVISEMATGRYVEINEAWCRLFGYSREEAVGRLASELGIWPDPADRERIRQLLIVNGSMRNVAGRLRRRDGEVLDVTMTADTLELDGVTCVVSVVSDFTELRRTERLHSLSEERFTRVFRASPTPMAINNRRTGVRVDVNDAWVRLFGYSREEAIGSNAAHLNLWADAAQRDRVVEQFDEPGGVRHVAARLRLKSGEIVDALVSWEPIELDGEAHFISCTEDVTERKRAERHIEYLATRDHLTGLPNRLLFADRLRQAIAKAARERRRIALLFIDLDRFKDINDSLGHHIGDRLLIELAERLRGTIRACDTLARQGGDEFLVLIDDLDEAADAGPVARKLVEAIVQPVQIEGRHLSVSCSVGISVYPDDARDEAELMRNSDLAMYSVKESGRNGHRYYSAEMNARLTERLGLENRLRQALERGEFDLHYQPKIELSTGRVTGCEALLRWQHPEQGMILPGRFIAIAEETRLIVPIGAWVLRRACMQVRAWIDAGMVPVPVSVNLSVQQFDAGLPEAVAAALREARVAPALIEIEITETVMMTNSAAHVDIMRRLKLLGVKIALDDFGTGYSSLSYLREMDIDALKIDQSFVRRLPGSSGDGTIVAAIIAMAAQFRIKVIAEGVESQAQSDALLEMNCAEAQGFLFSHAVPQGEFGERFLRAA